MSTDCFATFVRVLFPIRMRLSLLLVALFVVLVSSGDAAVKKRKKFDGDFEFAEDSVIYAFSSLARLRSA